MSDNKKNPEILTSSLDLNQEKLADKEKNERVQEIVDTKNNKDIDNKINEIETASDTLVTNEQMKKELWAHKVEAEMTAREKIKEKWGETAERAKRNWWLIVWWVGSFFGIRRLWKKIKWNETTETSNSTNSTETKDNKGNTVINVDATQKKSWRQKAFPWLVGWAGVAGAWYYFRDKLHKLPIIGKWLDGLFNKRLSFEEALYSVQWNVLNNAKEDHLKNKMNLQWDKKDKLTIFGKEYKIDMEKKKIEWLDIDFVNYEDLITTLIIIWSSQYTFKGACNNNTPFSLEGGDIVLKKGDISETMVSGRGFPWWKILWWAGWLTLGAVLWFYLGNMPGAAIGGIWWAGAGIAAWEAYIDGNNTLSKICPTLNDDINKSKLQSYLNKLWWWESWNDAHLEEKATTNDKKVNEIFVKTFEKIQKKENIHDDTNRDQWEERDAYIKNYQWRKNIFELKTRSSNTYLHADIDAQWNIKTVEIEDIWVKFTWPKAVEQAIHLWSFISKCEKELAWKWDQAKAFEYKEWWLTVSVLNKEWVFFDESGSVYDRKLSKDVLESNIPDLLQNNNMDTFISWMNSRKSWWQSLWTNKTWSWRKNTYLETLGNKQSSQGTLLTVNEWTEQKQKKSA